MKEKYIQYCCDFYNEHSPRVLCETACELLDGYAHQDAMVILDDLEEALRGASD